MTAEDKKNYTYISAYWSWHVLSFVLSATVALWRQSSRSSTKRQCPSFFQSCLLEAAAPPTKLLGHGNHWLGKWTKHKGMGSITTCTSYPFMLATKVTKAAYGSNLIKAYQNQPLGPRVHGHHPQRPGVGTQASGLPNTNDVFFWYGQRLTSNSSMNWQCARRAQGQLWAGRYCDLVNGFVR